MHLYKKRYLLLILMALLFLPLQAQKKGFFPGYVITIEGDTLKGWVKDRSTGTFTELYSRIRFKSGNSGFKNKYSPDRIQEYSCNGQVYKSVPVYEESAFFMFRYYIDDRYDRVFLRVIARDEPLTYFHWEYIDADSNYLDYIPLFYLDGSSQMVRVTQGILGLKRNRLMEYFRNCPELVDAIERKSVNETTEVYNFYLNRCLDP